MTSVGGGQQGKDTHMAAKGAFGLSARRELAINPFDNAAPAEDVATGELAGGRAREVEGCR